MYLPQCFLLAAASETHQALNAVGLQNGPMAVTHGPLTETARLDALELPFGSQEHRTRSIWPVVCY